MLLTNLILSSLILIKSPLILDSFSCNNFSSNINFNDCFLINYITSVWLIYQDIFEYTKKEITIPKYITHTLYTKHSYDSEYDIVETKTPFTRREGNPIANFFWEKNLWELGYLTAISLNTVIVSYFNKIDNSKFISSLYLTAINICEFYAIMLWEKISNNPSFYTYVPIFYYSF